MEGDIRQLPPNFADLPRETQIFIEELIYQKQLIHSHGYKIGEFFNITKSNKENLKKTLEGDHD